MSSIQWIPVQPDSMLGSPPKGLIQVQIPVFAAKPVAVRLLTGPKPKLNGPRYISMSSIEWMPFELDSMLGPPPKGLIHV